MMPDEFWLNGGIDNELDLERSLQLQERLARDPVFRDEWERRLALRNAVRDSATRHVAPDALRASVLAAIEAARQEAPAVPPKAAVRAAPRFGRREWLLALGSALAASALTFAVLRPPMSSPADDPLRAGFDDALSGHARAFLADRLVEVESTNQHVVKPWLSARLNFAPVVSDLSSHGFELVGARRDIIDGQTVAALIYRRRLHVISAYLMPATGERAVSTRTVRGFHAIAFAHGGTAWWLVSDLNARELTDLAELLRASS
jgi:anti-sigma factor RsiW